MNDIFSSAPSCSIAFSSWVKEDWSESEAALEMMLLSRRRMCALKGREEMTKGRTAKH